MPGMMHGMAWVECWLDCSCQWEVLCCSGEEVLCLVEGVLLLLLGMQWLLGLLVLARQVQLLLGWMQWEGGQQPVAWMEMLGPAYYLGKVSLRPKRCLHHHHPA